MPESQLQPLVIGGGIVGLATAMALAEEGHTPTVLEAESEVAAHQTGHNSGVIHSGLYYRPGSRKARLCTEGLKLMYRFCEQNGIAVRRSGKIVVAVSADELPRLQVLEDRGIANNVSVKRVGPDELRDIEPSVSGIAGLWVEDTGVVDYSHVAKKMAERIKSLGGAVLTSESVQRITRRTGSTFVNTDTGEHQTRLLINCAGLRSDRIARLAGLHPQMQVIPFRGEYYVLSASAAGYVKGLIYPVPDPAFPFLGVHFTRGINDTVEAGPNAVLALDREGYSWRHFSPIDVAEMLRFPGFWRMAARYWKQGVAEVSRSVSRRKFLDSLRRLIPLLEDGDIEAGGSGVRAQAVLPDGSLLDDFHIVDVPGQIHVLNAPSPAATASIAIGRYIAARGVGRDKS